MTLFRFVDYYVYNLTLNFFHGSGPFSFNFLLTMFYNCLMYVVILESNFWLVLVSSDIINKFLQNFYKNSITISYKYVFLVSGETLSLVAKN